VKRPGEFELIERFTRPFGPGAGIRVGIGDDAAVLRPPPGQDLVATVDAVVEGVHFTHRFTPEEIGWKALAVNLSDLAAMGARPLWALVALSTPPAADPGRLERIGRGIAACARRHALSVVGGNVTAARQLSLTVTVLGAVGKGRALLRSGGRPGDLLVVSGTLGDAALGLLPGAASAAPAPGWRWDGARPGSPAPPSTSPTGFSRTWGTSAPPPGSGPAWRWTGSRSPPPTGRPPVDAATPSRGRSREGRTTSSSWPFPRPCSVRSGQRRAGRAPG
jgi:hypothetical protein